MKMKKLSALFLATIMSFGMAGCIVSEGTSDNGTSDNATSENGTSENTPSATKTDETLFTELKTAIAATDAYAGAITISGDMKNQQIASDPSTDETESMEQHITAKASSDPASKLYYMIESSENSYADETESIVATEKLFKSGNDYYHFQKSQSTSTDAWDNYEEYTKVSANSDYFNIDDSIDMSSFFGMAIGGTCLADTYAELTSAYSTVYTSAMDNFFAQMDEEEFNPEEGDSLSVTHDVAISETNGEITLSIILNYAVTDIGEEGTQIVSAVMSRSVSVKNGMVSVVSIAVTMDMEASYDIGEESITQKQTQIMEMDYAIDYAFDQAGYDAISVSLPSEEEILVEEDSYNKAVTLMLGDIDITTEMNSSVSFEDAISKAITHLEEDLNDYNYEANKKFTVEGIYYDKEFTQAIDPATITEEQFFALDTIYVKYTLAEGFFMHCTDYKDVEQYSKPYQIVMSQDLYSYGYYRRPSVESVSDYEEGIAYEEGYDIVSVNGVQTTESSFVPVAGGCYNIVYTTVATDADVTILDLLNFIM